MSAETGAEIKVWQVGPGCEVVDTFGDWAVQSDISDSDCVLVRPDAHVCWRQRELTAATITDLAAAMNTILGWA